MFNDYLIEKLHQKGAALIGFADLSILPPKIRKDYPYGISIAIALDPHIVSRIPSGPHLDYYHEHIQANERINELCEYTADLIEDKGYRAFPQSKKFIQLDKSLRTLLPHKTVATLAGMGWIGKSALLVNEKYGCAIRITSVLTDMPLIANTAISKSKCGNCMKCTLSCPGKAISGRNWSQGIDRDELLNPYLCIDTILKRGKSLNITEGACGICLAVCPYTQRYISDSIHGSF